MGSRLKTIVSRLGYLRGRETRSGSASDDEVAFSIDAIMDGAASLHNEYAQVSESMAFRIEALARNVSKLYPTLNAVHRAYVEYSARCAELEKENAQLLDELTRAHEENAAQKQRNSDLDQRLQAVSEQKAGIAENLLAAEDRMKKLEERLGTVEGDLARERRRRAELQASESESRERVQKRESELQEARNELARMTNNFGEVSMTLEVRDRTLKRLVESHAQEKAARTKAESLLVHASGEVQSLRSAARQSERDSEASRRMHEADIGRTRAEAQELKARNDGLQSRVDMLEKILSAQRLKVAHATKHIGYLQKSVRHILSGKPGAGDIEIELELPEIDEDAAPAEDAREEPASAGETPPAAEQSPKLQVVKGGSGSR